MALLQLSGVTKSYGDLHALYDVTLNVQAGEWVSVVGPSGSGKSTMMNIIGCLDSPTAGSVVLDGTDLATMSASRLTAVRRQTIGLIFQKFHLVSHLTAVENVMVAQYYHSVPERAEALVALERVGLRDRAHHLPSQLSGGEQQRVCIARALINYPQLVLADEPTGNLDEANEQLVLDFFRQLHADGTTLVVVTHDPVVAGLADRQIVLDHGRLVREIDNAAARR
ncbi:ABC transporter ATP-binding protein [Propionicimonas sp.]|uniref:ABC transporter ATP-binding protein n=1 Tax=Propionicimonas sp. TaxID=1955623 RepID=UPI0039E6D222